MKTDPIVTEAGPGARRAAAAWGLCLLIALLGAAGRYAQGYEPDELQNIQFAANLSHGLVPYRDFFEHHPPLFPYLIAPLIGRAGATDARLLLSIRVIAFLGLVLLAWAIRGLCRACRAGRWAPWAVLALLLTTPLAPVSGALYELRADWWGLFCLMTALTLLAARSLAAPPTWRRAAGAGVLSAVAVLCTQKAAMLLVGVALWQAGTILASRPGAPRRRRCNHALIFYTGLAAPLILALLLFASQTAAGAFLSDVILVNLHWPHEPEPWTRCWSLAAAANPLVLALGLGGAACTVAGGRLRRHLRRASPAGLLALVLAAGLLSFIATPVPYWQSLIFFVWPWSAVLAAVVLRSAVAHPRGFRWATLAWMAAGLVLCLAPLRWASPDWSWGVKRLALALVLAAGAIVLCRRVRTTQWRAVVVGAMLLLPAAYAWIEDVHWQLKQNEARPYLAAEAAANKLLPRDIGVIEPWPLLAALHPGDRFGFQPWGLPRKTCEDAHLRALQAGRAGAVMMKEEELRATYPRLAAYLDLHAVRVGDPHRLLGMTVYRAQVARNPP